MQNKKLIEYIEFITFQDSSGDIWRKDAFSQYELKSKLNEIIDRVNESLGKAGETDAGV